MRRTYKKLRSIYDRGPESIRLKRLTVYTKSTPEFPADWTQITFNGLQMLELKGGSLDSSTKCSEFLARHELLMDIIMRDASRTKELACFPCMWSFHNAVVAQDLGLYFLVDYVWLTRGEEALQIGATVDEDQLRVKQVKLSILDRVPDVISCALGNLPPCAELSLMFAAGEYESHNVVVRTVYQFILPYLLYSCRTDSPSPTMLDRCLLILSLRGLSQTNLWDIILENTPNLQALVTLQLALSFDDGMDGSVVFSRDMVAITALGERLAPTIREIVKRCPRLSNVIVSQPIRYGTHQRFFKFIVPKRMRSETEQKMRNGAATGEGMTSVDVDESKVASRRDEESVVVECEIHSLSSRMSLSI